MQYLGSRRSWSVFIVTMLVSGSWQYAGRQTFTQGESTQLLAGKRDVVTVWPALRRRKSTLRPGGGDGLLVYAFAFSPRSDG